MNSKVRRQNILLSRITLISSIGDYFTIFALMQITEVLFKNTVLSAYNIAAQAAGIVIASIFAPYVLSNYSIRRIIFWSQLMPAILLVGFLYLLNRSLMSSPFWIYLLTGAVTFFYNLFFTAREAFSKNIATTKLEHGGMLADILKSFYSAQTIGPLIAFLLIKITNYQIPIFFDSLSFLLCAVLSLKLQDKIVNELPQSVFSPLKYLVKDKQLLKIFFLRSTLFWIPMSIFNIMIYPLITQKTGMQLIDSAWTYISMGFGSFLSVYLFKKNIHNLINRLGVYSLYFQLIIGIGCFLAGWSTSFLFLVFVNFLIGIGIGGNALTTQAIRRHLTSNTNFSEIVSLESIIGRFNEWLFCSIITLLLLSGTVSFYLLSIVCLCVFILSGVMHLGFDNPNNEV